MILYNSNTGELKKAPCVFGAAKYSEPVIKKGVYEYIKPDFDPETQTLDGIIIDEEKQIATNVIIPYQNWEFSDCHCRIWAKKNDCESRRGGALAEFVADLTAQMTIANKNTSQVLIKNNTAYYLFYATFLEKEDGFYLDNGIINIDNKSKLFGLIEIEQYTSFTDTGELLIQDNL